MIRTTINAMRDRWADLHPFLRIVVFPALLALAALLVLKPGYRAFKAWRMERNLAAAMTAVQAERMDQARDLSLAVLNSGDKSIEAYRILEESTASLRDPRHESIARALLFHPEASGADRLRGFRALAPESPMGLVGRIWTQLPKDSQLDPEFAGVFAERLIAASRFGEAASVLLAVPQAARTDDVERQLARILIGSRKADGFKEAQRIIAAKIQNNADEAAAWLDLLEQIPPPALLPQQLVPVRMWLIATADTQPARKALMLARMDYAADFPRRAMIINAAVERWQESDPEALAAFLSDLGLHRKLLDTYPPGRLAAHPGLFPHVLDALERTGRWDQVRMVLDDFGNNMPKYELLARRAIAAARTGDTPAKAQEWDAAMNEARSSQRGNALLRLHQIAQTADMRDEAGLAMVEAIRRGRGPLPLYSELKPLLLSLEEQGRDNILLEICATYLAFEQNNPVLLTQYSYLACLSDRVDPGMILQSLQLLGAALSDQLPVQMVLATAYLCNGQAGMAAETLGRLDFDPDRLSPSFRAIFLTTQVLSGRLTRTDAAVANFAWDSLLPSERRKFTSLIAGHPAS
jgi:hypothetical protein